MFDPGEAEDFLDSTKTSPELLTEARRKSYLNTLEILFAVIADRDASIDKLAAEIDSNKKQLREARACQMWIMKQFLPHVHPDVIEKIWIERRVNTMDPDFSFQKAIGPA